MTERWLRWISIASVGALLVGCTSPTVAPSPTSVATLAASSGQVADLHRQAEEALARWDAALAARAGGSGFALVGGSTLMVGDDWGPKTDGNNAKSAWYAGLLVVANPLPSDVRTTSIARINPRRRPHLAQPAPTV